MRTRRSIGTALLLLALSAQPEGAGAEGVTAYLESSGTESKPRSNAGVAVEGERVRMRAGLQLRAKRTETPLHALQRRSGGSTEVVPSLRSTFALAEDLALETRVSFAEWNAHSATTFDTRLRYRRSLDFFFDELDGSVWRSPDGATKQSVRLGFNRVFGDSLEPLTLTGEALFEATQNAAAVPSGTRTVGFETRVAGFMPALAAAEHSLLWRVEKTEGTRPQSASALSFEQSWAPSPLTELGLNLRFVRQTESPVEDFEPSIGFSWHSRF